MHRIHYNGGIMDIDTQQRYRNGVYGRILDNAREAVAQQWVDHEPLEQSAAFCGREPGYNRPTEYYACFLWGNGYLPGNVYVDADFATPPHINHSPPVDWDYVGQPATPHPDAIGRVCVECKSRKPLTKDFWHRDGKGRDGFKTICKACRSKEEHTRYIRKRIA